MYLGMVYAMVFIGVLGFVYIRAYLTAATTITALATGIFFRIILMKSYSYVALKTVYYVAMMMHVKDKYN